MRYDKRHFTKLEDLRGEVEWAKQEHEASYDPAYIKEKKEEERRWRKELREYTQARPGLVKAYNVFIRNGGDTLK